MRKFQFLVLVINTLLVILILPGCNDSNSPTSSEKQPVEKVTNITLTDVDRNSNGSDLLVSFSAASDETNISEYRIIIVKSSKQGEFSLETAQSLDETIYTSVTPNNSNIELRLDENAVDSDSDPITENIGYVAFVLSVSSSSNFITALSEPSAQLTLNTTITVSTVASLSAATGGIDIDAEGNIYVADIGSAPARRGRSILKVTPDGQVSEFATGGGMNGASGNAFDSQGNLFQSSISANRIHKITPSGSVSTFASSGLSAPVGIAIDENDTLYVCNCGNGTIQKISPDGVSTRLASSSLFDCPNGITLGDDGNLYVANFRNGDVLKVTKSGDVSFFATVPGDNNGHIVFNRGLFYVAARGDHRIYTIDMSGNVEVFAGTGERGHDDGSPETASFSLPNDLIFNAAGDRLYLNEVQPTSGSANIPSVLRVIEFGN